MRLYLILALCASMLVVGCKDAKERTSEEEEAILGKSSETEQALEKGDRIKDCDDFLDRYENWANTLMDLMEEHKDDPIALVTSAEYTKTMGESASFMQDWQTISFSCASNPYYETRMEEIQANIKKRNEALGFDK